MTQWKPRRGFPARGERPDYRCQSTGTIAERYARVAARNDWGMWIDERGSDVLELPECRRLLAVGGKEHLPGHLGFIHEGLPTVLPVDYAVDGHDVVLLVGEGLYGQIADALVAFQVDGVEGGRAWSVLARGHADLVKETDVSGHLPKPRVGDPGHRVVRIRADIVSGRRLAGEPPS